MIRQKTDFSWHHLFLIFLLWGVFYLVLPTALTRGIQADEGVHITVAQEVARGEVVYRDLFENRTPAVEWLLASVIWLGGPPLESGRLLAIGAMLISACALTTLTRLTLHNTKPNRDSASSVWAGLIAAILFLMAPLNLFWSRFFVLEPFVTLFALLGATYLLFALHKQEKNQQARNGRYWLISGVWLGIAILAKHTAIVTLSVFVVFLLAYASGLWATKTNKFRWQQISLWFAGLALPLLLFTIILISQNAFADFQQFLSGTDRVEVTAGFTDKLTVFYHG